MPNQFTRPKNLWNRVALIVALVGFSGTAFAQLEEIVVTAQKREQSLQDVPLSVTAYSGEILEQKNIKNLGNLASFEPSLTFQPLLSRRGSVMQIRGIGSDGLNAGIDSSVGVYLDGVVMARLSGMMNALVDVERIEVLKGPQGTLYGANTPAGVISVTTRAPTQEFEGRAEVGVGNFGLMQVNGSVSGAVSDNWLARATYWSSQDDGYMDLVNAGRNFGGNEITKGRKSVNGTNEWGVRLRNVFLLSEDSQLEIGYDYSEIESTCCHGEWVEISDEALERFAIFSDRTGIPLSAFPSRQGDGFQRLGEKQDFRTHATGDGSESIKHLGLTLKYDSTFASGHQLSVAGSFRDFDTKEFTDQDWMPADTQLFNQPETHETYTLEATIASPADAKLGYVAGLYYFRDEAQFNQVSTMYRDCAWNRNTDIRVGNGTLEDTVDSRSRCRGAGRSDVWKQDHDSYAAFASVNYNFTDTFRVEAGVRYSRDEKQIDKRVRVFSLESEAALAEFGLDCPLCSFENGFPDVSTNGLLFGTNNPDPDASVSNSEPIYSLSAQWFPADSDVMFYARYATGYKAPGINARPIRVPTIPLTYFEETSTNIELGMKSTLFDNTLRLNVAVYDNNFEDLQQVAFNPGLDDSGVQGTFVQNAGTLNHFGVEADYVWQPTSNFQISGSFAYLDSEFEEFNAAPCPARGDYPESPVAPGLCDYNGQPNAFVPEFKASNTIRWDSELNNRKNWFAQASWNYSDSYHVRADYDERSFQPSFSTYDASVGLADADGKWVLALWGRNLSDEAIITWSQNPSVPGINGTRGSWVNHYRMPRSYGVRYSMNF